MSWSAGTFTRAYGGSTGCADDAAANIGIVASTMDNRLNDLATGINTCITKDGQNAATANLPMGGNKHTNVAAGSARTDYTQIGQLQDGALISATMTGSSNTFVSTLSIPITAYADGQMFLMQSEVVNTSSCTLNINSIGAKAILYPSGAALKSNAIISRERYLVAFSAYFNGFLLLNASSYWQSYSPTFGGFSVNPTGGTYLYRVSSDGRTCEVQVRQPNNGTSNATNFTISLPINSASDNAFCAAAANVVDNGVTQTAPGYAYILNSYTAVTINKDWAGGNFTASGGKSANFNISYKIA